MWIVGCQPSGDVDLPVKPPETQPTTATGVPTGTTTTETTTTYTEPPNCDGEPLGAGSYQWLDLDSSEDFTIGSDGMMYGISMTTQGLTRQTIDGSGEMLFPNVSSWGRGVRFLSDGRLVVAEPDSGVLLIFDPVTWGSQVLVAGLVSPNGLAIDDRDFIYLTQLSGRVLRIHPDTGDYTVLHDTPVSTDGITFAPDYRTLYWNSEEGQVIRVVLNDDGEVIDGPTMVTEINFAGGWGILDGMAADACGNVYVVKMEGEIIKVTPDGDQSLLVDLTSQGVFISAVNFGPGFGGFEEGRMYVMDLGQGVYEIDVGIPGKWEPHW